MRKQIEKGAYNLPEEESSSSDSEASDNVDDVRNLPEGAPRISSCALIEDGEEEQY